MKTQVALETIAFQGKAFFDDLTAAVSQLRKAVANKPGPDYTKFGEAGVLCQVIKRHTNLTVTLGTEYQDTSIGIYCPFLVNNHIFDSVAGTTNAATEFADHELNIGLQKLLEKHKSGFMRASVDIRKNKVESFFSQIPFVLVIQEEYLSGTLFTDREMTAVILHEIGHAFTSCEYINRTVATNQVLADIAAARSGNKEEMVTAVIIKAASEQDLTAKQKDALLACTRPQDYVIVAYAVADEKCRSELGLSVYESTSCEQLADQYAARCGAGRDLVLALDKLMHSWGSYSDDSKATSIGLQLTGLAISSAISSLLFATSAVSFAMLGAISAISVAFLGGLATSKFLPLQMYDNIPDRFARIKHQLIEQLKDHTQSAAMRAALLADIAEIEKTISYAQEHSPDRTYSYAHYVALLISGMYRKRFDMELLQKQLESLASNNLFVQAAKLKTLS